MKILNLSILLLCAWIVEPFQIIILFEILIGKIRLILYFWSICCILYFSFLLNYRSQKTIVLFILQISFFILKILFIQIKFIMNKKLLLIKSFLGLLFLILCDFDWRSWLVNFVNLNFFKRFHVPLLKLFNWFFDLWRFLKLK